jgi:hypothetical protein
MLALLERSVTDGGGTYAMEDTDSLAIVATEKGGPISLGSTEGHESVKALSWREVEQISKKFELLNPYDRNAVPGSILKIEDDNRHPVTKKQRQLYCVAISTK